MGFGPEFIKLQNKLDKICKRSEFISEKDNKYHKKAREIGEELSNKFGHSAMVTAHHNVKHNIGSRQAHKLDWQWNGIGGWMADRFTQYQFDDTPNIYKDYFPTKITPPKGLVDSINKYLQDNDKKNV